MYSQKIIEALNNDLKVKEFMELSKQAALRTGVSESEWQKAKEQILLPLCIKICKPAMDILAREVYDTFRNQESAEPLAE